jgi:hypothetical protein
MGLLGKLAFWRREEPALPKPEDFGKGLGGPELGLPGEDLGLPKPTGMPDMPEMPGAGAPPPFPEPPRLEEVRPEPALPPGAVPVHPAAAPGAVSGKDLEIISLKLDSLKTTLEAINERLARLEKMAEGGRESPRF